MTDKFTDEFIREQRELAGKATPGELFQGDGSLERLYIGPDCILQKRTVRDFIKERTAVVATANYSFENHKNDVAYWIAAANHYPDALDEIERLLRLCAMKDDALGSYAEFYEKCQSLCGLPDANPSTEMDGIILTRLAEHDEIERLQKRAKGLDEVNEMYKTMLRTKDAKLITLETKIGKLQEALERFAKIDLTSPVGDSIAWDILNARAALKGGDK